MMHPWLTCPGDQRERRQPVVPVGELWIRMESCCEFTSTTHSDASPSFHTQKDDLIFFFSSISHKSTCPLLPTSHGYHIAFLPFSLSSNSFVFPPPPVLLFSYDMTCTSPFFSITRTTYNGVGGLITFSTNSLHLHKPINTIALKPHKTYLKPCIFYKFHPPSATLSSFAEPDNEPTSSSSTTAPSSDSDSSSEPAMAKAFNISSQTASAICICIAFATLTFPLAMKSLGQGACLKIKALSYVTLLSGFYMAWNIGANDVANAMGTSVGSGALTLPQAVLTAAVLEFSGAMLMGTHVTSTMQKGILVSSVFQGNDSLLFVGLLSSLAAAGSWLQV